MYTCTNEYTKYEVNWNLIDIDKLYMHITRINFLQ